MNDALGVRGIERIGDLNGQIEKGVGFESLPLDSLPECVALQQFHHDVGSTILLANLMNRPDVGMVQR